MKQSTNKQLLQLLQEESFNLLSLEAYTSNHIATYLNIKYRDKMYGMKLCDKDVESLDRVESILYGLDGDMQEPTHIITSNL